MDQSSPLAAALAAANKIGMWAESGETIASTGRQVILLEPCHVVAKVAWPDQLVRFTAEVEVCEHVQRARGPVVPPLLRADAGPYVEGGFVVSFWEHLPPEIDHEALEVAALPAYLELLTRLQDYPGALPWFTEPVLACREAIADGILSSLAPNRARLVEREICAIESIEVPAAAVRVLHGDPHVRNLTHACGETLWLDLKAVCRGPLERLCRGLVPPEGVAVGPRQECRLPPPGEARDGLGLARPR